MGGSRGPFLGVCWRGSRAVMLPWLCSLPITHSRPQDHPGLWREGSPCMHSQHDGVFWGQLGLSSLTWGHKGCPAPLRGRGTCVPIIVVAELLLCPQPWCNSVSQ